jgi:uncharacterized repeat protein (TIGR01451 family)
MYRHIFRQRQKLTRLFIGSAILIVTLILAIVPFNGPAHVPASAMDLTHFPLSFVPNLGQASPLVKFQVHSGKDSLFFTRNDVFLLLRNADGLPALVNLHFVDANLNPTVTGVDPLPGAVNYLQGTDPSKWLTDLPTFGAIVYEDLYPGVDLRYDGVLSELKGTFTLAPGVDPTIIRWRHLGPAEVSIDEETGDLIITLDGPGDSTLTLVEGPPEVSQNIDGEEVPVEASYVIHDDGSVGFELGEYDPDYPLIIDPTLTYSTYLGGSNLEDVEGIAAGDDGSMYVVGTTMSWDFPLASSLDDTFEGDEDIYVTKINATGDALAYSTYIGGGQDDEGNAIAVDEDGNAYFTGATSSSDFPTQTAYQGTLDGLEDAYVAKLNAAGNALVYSTYLGGSHLDDGADVAVDGDGNAYVTGMTFSDDFPVQDAIQSTYGGGSPATAGDAFITKLNATGDTLAYSTYMGGNKTDAGVGIRVDTAGSAYVVGETWSANFPTQSPIQAAIAGENDLFVAKLNAAGDALAYSTYLGGSGKDYSYALDVDGSGNAYVTGNTLSTDYPTMNPLQAALAGDSDGFVTKLNAAGDAWVFSSYLGGAAFDKGAGIAVNSAGEAYLTGETASADFPVDGSMQDYQGETDAFLVKMMADGSGLLYGTYLGGASGDYGVDVAVDDAGAFLAGITFSTDFPTVDPIYDTYSGTGDVFVAKISDEPGPTPPPAPNFSASSKSASEDVVSSGEMLIYTVSLYNSGEESGTASVTDPIPSGLNYVTGSATMGGTYDPGTDTVSWTDVTVAADTTQALTFAVTATEVAEPTVISNTAEISTDSDTYERHAAVLILPDQDDEANLRLSQKLPSKAEVSNGEMLTYTIKLINSGSVSATVAVTDPIPSELNYVAGSANMGGSYDSGTDTLLWTDITVAAADHEELTFVVTPTEVTKPVVVENIATIAYDSKELERHAVVVVSPKSIPEPPDDDEVPVVHKVVIDEQDVLTDPSVTLHISATDDVAVEWMHIREWYLETDPIPHWEIVKTTDWLPFQEEAPWTLSSVSGVHFVGVWVADAEYNTSWLNDNSLDYASLLLPDESVPMGGFVPYMVHYEAGETVNALLEPSGGDPDLYVWYPGNLGLPDTKSINSGTAADSVSFTTPEEGAYLFLVHGYTAATYDLTITPSGVAEPLHTASTANTVTELGDKSILYFEPIFSLSGLNPVSEPTADLSNKIFLPLITK